MVVGETSVWGKRRPVGDAAARQEAEALPSQDDGLVRSGGSSATRAGMVLAIAAGVGVVAGITGLALVSTSPSGASGQSNAQGYNMAHVAAGRGGSSHTEPGPATSAELRVVSVTPSGGSVDVSGVNPLQVVFSAPLAAHGASPVLMPGVPGQWQLSGNSFTFTPAIPMAPSTSFTLRIPAGSAGVKSAAGGLLAKPVTVYFKTAAYSQLRLAELLSQLGYLPMSWQSTAGGRLVGDASGSALAGQQIMAYSPPPGSFSWSAGYPSLLRSLWQPGPSNPLIRGAVMAFQAQHRLNIDGVASRKFWHALFIAADAGQRNTVGYTYAIASKGSPETLTIWHDGKKVFRSLANTGIPVAPTASGTYPVFLRYRYQIMQGTNPDGSHYADPVSFVSYFDGGEAVHYFPRGSYGSPQSLGCVELPYDAAQRAWPYLTYGSLVTVTN